MLYFSPIAHLFGGKGSLGGQTLSPYINLKLLDGNLSMCLFYLRKTNIFDNMVYMTEKYSVHLEEIVEERTSSLIEEKHKVEALLERMLPKSVARQLMKG